VHIRSPSPARQKANTKRNKTKANKRNQQQTALYYSNDADLFLVQVDDAFVTNINRVYYWNIDNPENFLYNGAIPQVFVI